MRVDERGRVRVIGVSRAARVKKRIVRVEHSLGEQFEPFPCETACILSLLPHELDLELALEFISLAVADILKTILKYLLAVDAHKDLLILVLGPHPLNLCLEDCPLILESKHARSNSRHFDDGNIE